VGARGAGCGRGGGQACPPPASKFQRGQWQAEGGEGGSIIKRPCSPLLVEGRAGGQGRGRAGRGEEPWDIPLAEEDPTALLPLGAQGGSWGVYL